MKLLKYHILFTFFMISACATIKKQIADNQPSVIKKDSSKIEHTFYLIGDAGNSTLEEDSPALNYLKKHIKSASEESTLLFLGDNVYETGIPIKILKNIL